MYRNTWELAQTEFDLVIVGGGIFGIFAAWDASQRGLSVACQRLISDSRAIERINVSAARWIARFTPLSARVGVNDAGAIRYIGGRRTIDLVGLNHHAIAYGKLSSAEIIAQLDWLAVFPARFGETHILRTFAQRQTFQIPLAEYTICDCPTQTRKVIYEKIR